ncbi:MAG TPA: hypothetical protein VH880_13440 [Anaeromyxobacteraceae bacterium]|jgi:hypothetical protein
MAPAPFLLLAAALGGGLAEFQAAFPAASVIRSPSGGRLTSASGFEAPGLGATPEAAARAFLARHGAAFGVAPRHELVLQTAPAPGTPGSVRFERRIAGLPLFDGGLAVGVDARGAVFLVNASDVPSRLTGRRRISERAAVRAAAAAIPGLVPGGPPRAARGWRAFGGAVRPVWRVDLAAKAPAGEWRSDVDAETGKVLFRTDLRQDGRRGG